MSERNNPHFPARRDFLKYLPVLVSAAPLCASKGAAMRGSSPTMQFPVEARARLAATSYPFRSMLISETNHARKPDLPGMDMKEFPAFIAETFNIFNVNPLLDHFSATDDAYINAFRKALDKAHSHIVDLGLGGKRFYSQDADVRRDAVEFGCKCLDIASKVGSPSVRQHVAGDAGQKADVALAAASLSQVAEYGAKKNVVVNVENDAAVAEDPFFLTAVIEKVNNPYLRGLPDFGNSLMGHDEQFNLAGVKAMLGHAFNMCHVKDELRAKDGAVYKVNLKPLFQLAKSSGYKGFFSMEFDTAVGDPMEGTRRLIKETLEQIQD